MDRDQIVRALRARLSGRSDVRLALLFGSFARDEAREGSDVDIAVQAPDVDLLELSATLSVELGREVDVLSLTDPGVPLREALVRDSIVVHEGTRGAAGSWAIANPLQARDGQALVRTHA